VFYYLRDEVLPPRELLLDDDEPLYERLLDDEPLLR
jgi:hypothetical protein